MRQQTGDNINCVEWFGATWSSLPNCSYTWPKLWLSLLALVVELLSFEIPKCSSQNGLILSSLPDAEYLAKVQTYHHIFEKCVSILEYRPFSYLNFKSYISPRNLRFIHTSSLYMVITHRIYIFHCIGITLEAENRFHSIVTENTIHSKYMFNIKPNFILVRE